MSSYILRDVDRDPGPCDHPEGRHFVQQSMFSDLLTCKHCHQDWSLHLMYVNGRFSEESLEDWLAR